jgi:hypothetical protein
MRAFAACKKLNQECDFAEYNGVKASGTKLQQTPDNAGRVFINGQVTFWFKCVCTKAQEDKKEKERQKDLERTARVSGGQMVPAGAVPFGDIIDAAGDALKSGWDWLKSGGVPNTNPFPGPVGVPGSSGKGALQ